MLSRRKSEGEHEASRRMKTEFLVQVDGAGSESNGVVTIACTNLPWDLDDAALRRFARRIYIPLPDKAARSEIIHKLMEKNKHNLSASEIRNLVEKTENFSASDITNLCKDASMGP